MLYYMHAMKRSRWRHLKNKWVIAGILILAVIVMVAWSRSRPVAPSFESTAAAVGDVIEKVSVTGSISPMGKADLSFEKGVVVTKVYAQVGQAIKIGDPIASLDSAADKAALASAQATLADLSRGLTPQELAVQQTDLANARKDVLNAVHDSYVKAQSAVVSYADVFFANAQSANPTIIVTPQSTILQNSINAERAGMGVVFDRWSANLAGASTDTAADAALQAHGYLVTIKAFMNDLSNIVNDLVPGSSGLSSSALNSYVTSMNTGLAAVNSAVDGVTGAETELSAAQSNYDLKLSGNSSQSIAAQAAKVAQAQALVDQDTLVSPIDGVVTKADPHVGEYVSPGASGFAVQNTSFKIEAYVPEADIAKVAAGDIASSTLDAYGSDTDFPARVIMVDPAETVLQGVPTYKVTLVFVSPDSRIRSGMTANLEILTHERASVLEIPYRAVMDDNGQKSVRLVAADGKSYASVPVQVGLKGSDGTIEILSGIKAGDKVVTYVK